MGLGLLKNNATCGKTSSDPPKKQKNLNNPYEDDIIYEQICLWFDLILYSLGSLEMILEDKKEVCLKMKVITVILRLDEKVFST